MLLRAEIHDKTCIENVLVLENKAGLEELNYIHYRIIIKCTCNTFDTNYMNITDDGFKAQEA